MIKYINPPLNYMGSKYKLLPQLEPLLDYSKKSFIDVFTGGGSVALNLGLNFDSVVMNDIISTDIHKAFIENRYNFISEVKRYCVKKDDSKGYLELRKRYNASFNPAMLMALILCCNSNMMRFNKKGEFNQTFGKRTYNESTEQKVRDYLCRVSEFREKEIPIITRKDRFQAIKWFKEDMVYLDPPYFNTEAGYNVFWSKVEENHLLEKCLSTVASVAVSGVLFDKKENSPLLLGLEARGWKKTILDMDYSKVRKNLENGYQEVLFTNY